MRTPLITLLLVSCLCACGDDDPIDELAEVRFVHASPDAPPVDVFTDPVGVPVITGLAYGQASPYIALVPGDYTVRLFVTGTNTLVYEAELQTDRDEPITAIATGYVESTSPSDAFRVITFEEDFDDFSADQARVRVVHAAPDVGTIDVDVGDDATLDVTELQRFADSGHDGLAVPANVPLQIGLEAGGTPITAFTTPALPGTELFVIAIGNAADLPRATTGLALLVVGPGGVIADIAQNPTVYALHASPDAPPIAIGTGAGGPVIAPTLAFGELAAAQIPPGDYTLGITAVGATGVTAFDAAVSGLLAGQRYLVIATGMATPVGNEQRLQLAVYSDDFATTTRPRLRAIHASPDAPLVDISTATGTTLNTPPLFNELQFLEASAAEGLVVGASPALHIGIAPARSTKAVATFDLDTAAIGRAFAIAAGALTPAPDEQSFRMFIVETDTTPWTLTTELPNPP